MSWSSRARIWLAAALAAVTVTLGGSPGYGEAPGQTRGRPNIVFFLVDDLGYMDIGANNPRTFYETPHIDRLAREGVRFTNAYAANPVCSPTRYSLLTGKYPTRAGVTNWFSGVREGRFRPAPLVDRMPLEEITFVFHTISWTYVNGGVTHEDTWNAQR